MAKKNGLWGPNVKETVMFDGNGRFSFQIRALDRSESASNNSGIQLDKRQAIFGTFTVEK